MKAVNQHANSGLLLVGLCDPVAGTYLDEVLMAPRVAELVCFPRLVHSQQGDVVTFSLEKLGTLLVSLAA